MPHTITTPDNLIEAPVRYVGLSSNTGAIMGACMKALRKAGNDKSVVDDYVRQVFAGDYQNALRVSMEFCPPMDEWDD